MTEEAYELVVAGPAAGALITDPRRVAKERRNELAGIHSAQRGSYRVLYRIDDERREVTVLRVEHRGDAYSPR